MLSRAKPSVVSAASMAEPLALIRARGKARFCKALRQTVTELFGSFSQIPLGMTAQAGMIIDDPQHQWVNPTAFIEQDAHRTVMKIQMPQSIDILALIAADLPSLDAMLGNLGAGTVDRTTAWAFD